MPGDAGYQMTTPPPISSARAAARSIFANREETVPRTAASESAGSIMRAPPSTTITDAAR
jgi:hypothetical protein